MRRNRRLFPILFITFTLLVILFTIDMARRTTAPWNRKKQIERAIPGTTAPTDGVSIDTTGLDSLATERSR